MHHALKSWQEYFAMTMAGDKDWEIRKNDRDYQPGDTVQLFEWVRPDFNQVGVMLKAGRFTGERSPYFLIKSITYSTPGLMDGYVGLTLYGPFGCNRILEVPHG